MVRPFVTGQAIPLAMSAVVVFWPVRFNRTVALGEHGFEGFAHSSAFLELNAETDHLARFGFGCKTSAGPLSWQWTWYWPTTML